MNRLGAAAFRVSLLLALCVPRAGWSQVAVEAHEEYAQRIKSSQVIGSPGPGLFGDEVNQYTGTLRFVQGDVSLPGTGALAVAVQREFTVGSPLPGAPYVDGLFSDWDIELPKIHGVFSVTPGWKAQNWSTGAITGERCTLFGQLPVVRGSDAIAFTPDEYWHGTSLSIPGAGSQEILLRASGNAKAPGNNPQQYRLVTPN